MKRHLVILAALMLITRGLSLYAGAFVADAPAFIEPAPMPPQQGGEGEGDGNGGGGGEGDPIDPNSPSAQQVEAALNSINEAQPNTRDAAEERLSSLGNAALPALKDAAGRYSGAKRNAAEAAIFRISNAIKPRDAIQAWTKKFVDGQRCKNERIADVALTDLFPHHLFYVLVFGEKAKLPANVAGLKTRTVIAMAADGKIQTLTEDAGLAHFLAIEGGELKSAGERARISEIAVFLACAREPGGYPAIDEIKTGEDKSVTTSEGANKKATVIVAMKVNGEGHVSSIAVTRGPAPPEKKTPAQTDPDSTEPATPAESGETSTPAVPVPPAVNVPANVKSGAAQPQGVERD